MLVFNIMKIGLIAMSAKPYHAGHDALIRLAARECDTVNVFVSLFDRRRPDEFPILGKDMERIWNDFIVPTLPPNIVLHFDGNPVRGVYEFLGHEKDGNSKERYVIYSDPDDIERSFPSRSLAKYTGHLYDTGQLVLEPVHRAETIDISGTDMRKFLDRGDAEGFRDGLPSSLKPYAAEIQQIFDETAAVTPKLKKKKNRAVRKKV